MDKVPVFFEHPLLSELSVSPSVTVPSSGAPAAVSPVPAFLYSALCFRFPEAVPEGTFRRDLWTKSATRHSALCHPLFLLNPVDSCRLREAAAFPSNRMG